MMAIGAYAVFLALAAAVIVKVGLVLKRHGDLHLRGKSEPGGAEGDRHVRSVTRLTLLGFGLITVGALALLLRIGGDPDTPIEALTFLATRGGALLVVVGAAHFHCLSVMARAPERPTDLPVGGRRGRTAGKPRQAREDPLDRVFEASRLNAPFGG